MAKLPDHKLTSRQRRLLSEVRQGTIRGDRDLEELERDISQEGEPDDFDMPDLDDVDLDDYEGDLDLGAPEEDETDLDLGAGVEPEPPAAVPELGQAAQVDRSQSEQASMLRQAADVLTRLSAGELSTSDTISSRLYDEVANQLYGIADRLEEPGL